MRLGLMTSFYTDARIQMPIELIQHAEARGFDSVWTAETYGADAITPLAYIGALTKKIRLCTGIAQLAARTSANLAMCAQTIDAMAGEGRMVIGIGVSGPQIVEGWYGQAWGKPNYRLRDTVAIVKKILAREGPVVHHGDPPELFKPGIPVVLEGHWQGATYDSDLIMVKHSEQYRAKNPTRVKNYPQDK